MPYSHTGSLSNPYQFPTLLNTHTNIYIFLFFELLFIFRSIEKIKEFLIYPKDLNINNSQ